METNEPYEVRSTARVPLVILTWICASSHNSVHFFDISTSKSGPYMWCFVHFDLEMCFAPQQRALFHFFSISTSKSGPYMWCFVHFDLEMCFAPQQRALFRHLNFQKWSGNGVLSTFWLGNVLRATTACTFSTSERPNSGPNMCVLFVHFDLEMCFNVLRATTGCTFSIISTGQSWLCTRSACLLFYTPLPQIIGVTQCFATFRTFCAPASSFDIWTSQKGSSNTWWLFVPLLFQLSILSEVSLLNFLRPIG